MKVTARHLVLALVFTLGACATVKVISGRVADEVRDASRAIVDIVAPSGESEATGDTDGNTGEEAGEQAGQATEAEAVKAKPEPLPPLWVFTLMGMTVAILGIVVYRAIRR